MKLENSNSNLNIDTREFNSEDIEEISNILDKVRESDFDVATLNSDDIKERFNTTKDINNESNKVAHSLRRLLALNLVYKRSKKKNKEEIAKENNLSNLISNDKEVLKSLENSYIKETEQDNKRVIKIYSDKDRKLRFKTDKEVMSLFTGDEITSIRTNRNSE